MSKDKTSVWDITKNFLKYNNPILSLIIETIEKAIEKSIIASESGDLQKLYFEAQRQEIALRMSEFQARVAQEVAIARRIDTAEEVEIEEFYDTSGKGNVGLNVNREEGNVTFGLGVAGEGRRVTKRIYRFRGWREWGLEVIEQIK